MSNINPAVLSTAGLAVEYCKAMAGCRENTFREVLRDVVRYLPRIYITVADLRPYGEDSDPDAEPEETSAIYDTVTEEQYDDVRDALGSVLGEYDMYLDAPVEDMRYSDTPVAVSLAEQLADIYQCMADFAATVGQCDSEDIPDVLNELKYRFATYLSETMCAALRAANYLYYNVNPETE